MQVAIDKIRLDGGTQPRAIRDEQVVSDYAEAMRDGATFPPVTVFYDGTVYWLADGFHRVYAAKVNKTTAIEADVRQGTQRDAILFSVGANAAHGLRRTNMDKRRAVERLLRDDEWIQWSDREIARRCAVSHNFVGELRRSLSLDDSENNQRTYTTKHGTPATMKTDAIGSRPALADNALPAIKDNVDLGLITVIQANELTKALQALPDEYHEQAAKLAGDILEKAVVLVRLYKSSGSPETNGTFYEIMATGGFAYGDSMEKWCNFKVATITEINKALASVARNHGIVKVQAKAKDAQSLPSGLYNVIYADPPWQYDNAIPGTGAAATHYPTLPLDKICSFLTDFPVQIDKNAVLFMWVTNPFLQDAFKVLEAWRFVYKTNMCWVKTEHHQQGAGFYVRGRHELLFIATRGSFTPLDKHISPPIGSVIEAPLGEHSVKPDDFYTVIERLYPGCNYLELFARRARNGWDYFGNEIG